MSRNCSHYCTYASFGRNFYLLNILITVLQFVTPQSHTMSSVGLAHGAQGQGKLYYS